MNTYFCNLISAPVSYAFPIHYPVLPNIDRAHAHISFLYMQMCLFELPNVFYGCVLQPLADTPQQPKIKHCLKKKGIKTWNDTQPVSGSSQSCLCVLGFFFSIIPIEVDFLNPWKYGHIKAGECAYTGTIIPSHTPPSLGKVSLSGSIDAAKTAHFTSQPAAARWGGETAMMVTVEQVCASTKEGGVSRWVEGERVKGQRERKKKVVKCQHHQRSLTPSQWDGEASSHRDRTEISALLHSSTVRLACCYMF